MYNFLKMDRANGVTPNPDKAIEFVITKGDGAVTAHEIINYLNSCII